MESRIDTALLEAHLQPCDATAIGPTCHTDTQRGNQHAAGGIIKTEVYVSEWTVSVVDCVLQAANRMNRV